MKTVLFACIHNAGRSQMAAAFFNHVADPAKASAISAGTRPADRVHPEVQDVMAEKGIDLSAAVPQRLTHDLVNGTNLLITMGCGDEWPDQDGVERDDWPLRDPKGQGADTVRDIRDDIEQRIRRFVAERGWAPPA